MQKRDYRVLRIAQEIKKGVALILQNEINDPKIGMITISTVKLSKDLSYAKIYVSFFNAKVSISTGIKRLQLTTSLVRYLLKKFVHLRIIPNIIFIYDHSLCHGKYISNLIDKAINIA
ncbi:30S ribosome-binding factor RbfA [Candidatus Schneideria nysicola]|uniref:30S ribosome-binding factor RbfA n=1 Tax=Candidatus Schneideria nysicola TaxID=1081631 RepID=UPI001CAA7CDF|nr:30S ribosome-binding factor RbfA [Candidatus Schneideria nysicola]UAJ65895.1 30S ribosome-binding factor RbfA [Candidatus Schneideria nysicola]